MCAFLEKVHYYHQILKEFHNSRRLRTVLMSTKRTREASLKQQVRGAGARFSKNKNLQLLRNQTEPRQSEVKASKVENPEEVPKSFSPISLEC